MLYGLDFDSDLYADLEEIIENDSWKRGDDESFHSCLDDDLKSYEYEITPYF